MEVKLKENILTIKRVLKKNETFKISKGNFDTISIFKKPIVVNGVSSYCGQGKHCLFIDYDNTPKWLVIEDFERLQKEYKLPQAYLFTTFEDKELDEEYGNYHIINLGKHYPKKIYEMLSKTHADVNFMSLPLRKRWRNWTLRISIKGKRDRPKFISLVGKPINENVEISKAHKDFLDKAYQNIKHPNYKLLDKNTTIKIQKYETSQKG